MPDDFDYSQERQLELMENRIREHQYQLGHAVNAYDVEAELCSGCNYATKASWGKTCDGWAECLQDSERHRKSRERNGKSNA